MDCKAVRLHTRCGGVVGFVYVLLAWATNLTVYTLPKQTRTGAGEGPTCCGAAAVLERERSRTRLVPPHTHPRLGALLQLVLAAVTVTVAVAV